MSELSVSITASYAFFSLSEEELAVLHEELESFGSARQMKGLVLLAPEGINSTVCGTAAVIAEWKVRLRELHPQIVFKDSTAGESVFRRWLVKIKPEIVALHKPDVRPEGEHRHLSPEEWHEVLQNEDVVVLDTRNDYEVAIGKFENAVNPRLRHFHQFPAYVQKMEIPKEQKVLMYCTGGIRCEKAVFAMEAEGYKNVYQLEGGILAYLEKFPHGKFEGECFVFDHRVAVDQELKPSQTFKLCAHCGNPAPAEVCEACTVQMTI